METLNKPRQFGLWSSIWYDRKHQEAIKSNFKIERYPRKATQSRPTCPLDFDRQFIFWKCFKLIFQTATFISSKQTSLRLIWSICQSPILLPSENKGPTSSYPSSSSADFSPPRCNEPPLPPTAPPNSLQAAAQLTLLNHQTDGFKALSAGWLGFIMANETPHYSLLSFNKCP